MNQLFGLQHRRRTDPMIFFIRRFRKMAGITPQEYRRQLKL